MADPQLILVTGATGYVGGRLVPRLLAAGYRVRCLVRDPARLQGRGWLKQVELARGDMLQPESLVPAMRDVHAVYYLVHSLGSGNAKKLCQHRADHIPDNGSSPGGSGGFAGADRPNRLVSDHKGSCAARLE